MTPPDTSPAAPVDTSAEAVARMVTWLSGMAERGGKRAVNNIDARSLGRAGATLAAVAKERDEAVATADRLTRWSNEHGGRYWEARFRDEETRADTASRQLAETRAALDRYGAHLENCSQMDSFSKPCDCGLARALLSGETTR